MKKILISSLAFSALLLVSCKTEFDQDVKDITVSNGNADFSKFVSIGNSLTSGYRDGALYLDGQNESFPSMIAKQMALAGGSQTFTQPLMPNNVGGFSDLYLASGKTDFYGKLTLSAALSPTQSTPVANLDVIGGAGKYFNNMGVPGAKSFHLVSPGYGSAANLAAGKANPYFVRFATSATTTVLADAAAQKPSFYTLWIGNNDVLSYATSGGAGVDRKGNLDPSTYGSNDISDPNVVANVIKTVITSLKTANANSKGAIANIPYVTSVPYFTTVPYDPFTGKITTESAAQLMSMQAYGKYNAGLATAKAAQLITEEEYNARLISFKAGTTAVNGAVIVDKDLTNLTGLGLPSIRQATAKDYILLPALTLIKDQEIAKGGTANPLADKYVLTEKEAAKVIAATDAYNTSISSLAAAYGLALVDSNAKMKELGRASGIQFDGVKYTAKFVTGGSFSLDGVHLTGRGYAIIANEFIKSINRTYGSTLPQVNVNSYSGVTFP